MACVEHHRLEQRVNGGHRFAGLDASKELQRIVAVAVHTDSEACLDRGGELDIARVHLELRVVPFERSLIEVSRSELGEPCEINGAVDRAQLLGDPGVRIS